MQASRLRPEQIPRHVAIIMDGNGRWAEQRGISRIQGHRAGLEAIRAVVRGAHELGIRYLTLYAFSIENWNRPKAEVNGLMRLLDHYLDAEIDEVMRNGVQVRVIGLTSLLILVWGKAITPRHLEIDLFLKHDRIFTHDLRHGFL